MSDSAWLLMTDDERKMYALIGSIPEVGIGILKHTKTQTHEMDQFEKWMGSKYGYGSTERDKN